LFEEAKGRPEWEKAMATEHESLMKNQTWDLTVKYKEDGTLDKYKAQLVAKGFSQ
jgi:hypothetical protein